MTRQSQEMALLTSHVLDELKSPLRYVGGKQRGVKYILPLFPSGLKEVISCFLGGGSVELALCAQEIQVRGYDGFPQLVEFWQELLTNPKDLSCTIQKSYPLSKNQFYMMQDWLHRNNSEGKFRIRIKAAFFYTINRCSFSGSTLSGGMSPDHPRFTLKGIRALAEFKCPNLTVECADFRESLALHPDMMAYCDPPYYAINGLYGHKGDLSFTEKDHHDLMGILHARKGKWILSYNDCPQIREMYKGYEIRPLEWAYGMNKSKRSSEVVILNL